VFGFAAVIEQSIETHGLNGGIEKVKIKNTHNLGTVLLCQTPLASKPF
jgi:hypothetical protein